MKIATGDLVRVRPARVGLYIVLEKHTDSSWYLARITGQGRTDAIDMNGGLMHEQFIEVISASR
jgi:hypothetical protein